MQKQVALQTLSAIKVFQSWPVSRMLAVAQALIPMFIRQGSVPPTPLPLYVSPPLL